MERRNSSRLSAKRAVSEPMLDDESDDFEIAPKPKAKAPTKEVGKEHDVESISDVLISPDDFKPVRTASGRISNRPKALATDGAKERTNGSGSKSQSGVRTRVRKWQHFDVAHRVKRGKKQEGTVEEVPAEENPTFDAEALATLGKEYPDPPTRLLDMLPQINKDHPIVALQSLTHPEITPSELQSGYVHGLTLSDDGELLASASAMGTIRIWDTRSWTLLQELRDAKEEKIEEFYVARFSPNSKFLIAAGKLKLRDVWNEEEGDNQITPGPIKIFDVLAGTVVAQLEGHTEEILNLERVTFKGANYLLSCSQDGRMIKWPMNEQWTGLASRARFISDLTSYYVFHTSFLPGCGNRYFVGACDEGVKLYDFETGQLLYTWADLYTCYCDCVHFVTPADLPKEKGAYYLMTRGVELLKDDCNRTIKPNTVRLYRMRLPEGSSNEWPALELVQTYADKEYFSNSWPTKFATNGYYVFAPTSFGEVFVWNIATAQLTATLVEHKEREVRDVLLHPFRPLLISCGYDSQIRVYGPAEKPAALNGSSKK